MTSLSIFRKTGVLALCLFGVISILASTLAAYTLYIRMTDEYISKGRAISQSIAGANQELVLGREIVSLQAVVDQYLDIEGVAYVFVVNSEHEVLVHTFVPQVPARLVALFEPKKDVHFTELTLNPYGRIIDICRPILAGYGGYVHVGMDKELIIEYFWDTIVSMQMLMFGILIVCVLILYFVTGRISRPLSELTAYAERLANRDFTATIVVSSDDEVGVLGKTMQSMATELSTLFSEMESEVQKATSELREHMVYLSAIIDNLADGLLVVSPQGSVSVINPAMREFFDLGDKSYDGFSARTVFPPEIADLAEDIRTCRDSAHAAEIPLSMGRTGKAIGSSICVDQVGNEYLGGVILIRDITQEKELDKLKMEFISTVSHELRTPMTSVLGFAKIIRKKLGKSIIPALTQAPDALKPVAQVQENMGIIVKEAERLTELINDVLDIAKMEAGKTQWRDDPVFMDEVFKVSLDSTRGIWLDKGIKVLADVEPGLPRVRGDALRLVQVMVNLISNAVKFSDEGPVICSAARQGSDLLVSVSDRGIGIEEDSLDLIFDKFKQVGDTLTGKPTGTGLGLPICRQIIEHHGGTIWAESVRGEGSVFSFVLPGGIFPRMDVS